MTTEITPIIIVDTREPDPSPWQEHFTAWSVRQKLDCGDYAVAGLQDHIAVERKSLPDLISSLTHQRERFERELQRARPYHFFAVVAETNLSDILAGRFEQSQANPIAIWESIAAFSVRYCPFFFAGNQRTAARFTESLLLKFAREHVKSVEAMRIAGRKALGNDNHSQSRLLRLSPATFMRTA